VRAQGAALAAVALVGLAVLLKVAVTIPGASPSPDRSVPVLLAAAALCAAGLSIRRAPPIAWLSAVAAAGIAALEILGIVRAWQPFAAIGDWPWVVAIAAAALVSATAIAAVYAGRRRSSISRLALRRCVGLAAVIGVGAVIGLSGWALAAAFDDVARGRAMPDLWPLRWTGRAGLGLIALGGIFGAVADLVAPVSRARRRLHAAVPNATSDSRVRTFLGLLGDELLPSAPGQRRRVADEERARLAADLHARVLPDLRRAALAAGAPGVPSSLAAGVRDALAEIEHLMEGRQSIVLESFGLVAALEWLAERTEDRERLRVDVELDGDLVADATAVPPDVRRAAFRIALLALDNVVRHAAASHATLRLRVDLGRLSLSIADDGLGSETRERPATAGRGLADMRSEAAAVGASLSLSSARSGTVVEVTWPAQATAEEPAIPDVSTTARPEAAEG
jgi:signal transduction histidine kinase